MVDLKRLPIPLYFQIASDLRQQIESGALAADAQLPNEKELARTYDVSLITVRGAMRLLLDDGLVVRLPGRGTFVARRSAKPLVWSIGSLDDLVVTGLKSTMRLLAQGRVKPPEWVRERLDLQPGSSAHVVTTLREAEGEAFMVTTQYHPGDLARALRKSDFTSTQARSRLVVQIVAERAGLAIANVRQTMSAEGASAEIAPLLGLRVGDPLLVVERDFLSADGRLIQTGRAHYRTDHYRYEITVSNQDAAGSGNVYRLPLHRRLGAGPDR